MLEELISMALDSVYGTDDVQLAKGYFSRIEEVIHSNSLPNSGKDFSRLIESESIESFKEVFIELYFDFNMHLTKGKPFITVETLKRTIKNDPRTTESQKRRMLATVEVRKTQTLIIDRCLLETSHRERSTYYIIASKTIEHRITEHRIPMEAFPFTLHSSELERLFQRHLNESQLEIRQERDHFVVKELQSTKPIYSLKIRSPLKIESDMIIRLGSAEMVCRVLSNRHLSVSISEVQHTLEGGEATVGRVSSSTIHIETSTVSSSHGKFVENRGSWTYMDSKSKNGSWLTLHTKYTETHNLPSKEYELTSDDSLQLREDNGLIAQRITLCFSNI
jgi:hypothetical protein